MADSSEILGEEMEMIHNLPRSARFETLISALRNDHSEIMRQLWILRMLTSREGWEDYETARNRALELETFLKRHISDEKSIILLMLTEISEGEEEKVSEDITAVFHQHKLIFAVFADIHNSFPESGSENRWVSLQKLDKIVSAHIKEEEDKIFPLLINNIQQKRKPSEKRQQQQEEEQQRDQEKPITV
ncbi:MAG: hemerythrin domain-containing protein [Nitrososphaerales archaeon]